MEKIAELLTLRNIIIYVICINLVAFLVMGIDKWKAKRGAWRIKESTLFVLVLLGGGIGGIAGIYTFRHKTQKAYFKYGFPVIIVAQIVAIIWFLATK